MWNLNTFVNTSYSLRVTFGRYAYQTVIGFFWHSSLTVTFASFWLGIRSFPGHFYFWTGLELKVPEWLTFQCLPRLHSLPFTGALFALPGLYKLITWKILFWFSISLFSELLSFYPNSAEEKQGRIENIKPPWFCFYSEKIFSVFNYFTAVSHLIRT